MKVNVLDYYLGVHGDKNYGELLERVAEQRPSVREKERRLESNIARNVKSHVQRDNIYSQVYDLYGDYAVESFKVGFKEGVKFIFKCVENEEAREEYIKSLYGGWQEVHGEQD